MDCRITKIIIFGSTGMLGRYISTFFTRDTSFNVINIDFRITNESINKLEEILIKNEIDIKTCVINCIGQIPQRKTCDFDNKLYFLVNSIFPHILWNICKSYGAKMIQPTTDCVFSGKRIEGNYLETDKHDEEGLYGMSKSLGEPLGCTVIRTSIIGREITNKKSFMEWVITSGQDKNVINGWTNHYWNGITCLEYCNILLKIINENLFWVGIRHIFSPDLASKYELVCYIKHVFELDLIINPIECNEISNKTLKSNYINIFDIPNIFEQIKDLKKYIL
jgi:dTDP-4-dehydrorhamnose reductase